MRGKPAFAREEPVHHDRRRAHRADRTVASSFAPIFGEFMIEAKNGSTVQAASIVPSSSEACICGNGMVTILKADGARPADPA